MEYKRQKELKKLEKKQPIYVLKLILSITLRSLIIFNQISSTTKSSEIISDQKIDRDIGVLKKSLTQESGVVADPFNDSISSLYH